jgi:hypothetical protein
MDDEIVRKIAAEVVRLLPNYAWVLLLVQALIMAVAAGAGAYFGEYLKTRGKNLATKADFESLQAQLSANTKVVETIKAEVGQRDWAQREWTNLRRIKLEALLEKMHDCEAYLARHLSHAMEGKHLADRDPQGELDAIAILFFPELKNEVSAYLLAYREQIVASATFSVELADLTSVETAAARQNAYDTFRVELKPITFKVLQATSALKVAARRLVVSIMGVDERPAE